MDTKWQLIDYALVAFGLPILGLLGKAAWAGVTWLVSKTKTTKDDYIAGKLKGLASLVVQSTYQAYVSPLKAAGEWTPDKHALAMASARQELRSYLGAKGLKEVKNAFGGDLEGLLRSFLEAAVYSHKQDGKYLSAFEAAPAAGPTLPSSASA